MKWLVQHENDISAHEVTGSFDDAVQFARDRCRTDQDKCNVYSLPRNVRMAEVGREGLRWVAPDWFECGALVTREHPEWDRMWLSLYGLTGSFADENEVSGERWQYMGTFWRMRPAIGALLPLNLLVHEFRHRDRPASCPPIRGVGRSHGRLVLHLTASQHYSGNWNCPIPEGTLA